MSGKIFNRDVILAESARLRKSVDGAVVDVIDADGNIDRPITTTDATFTGDTTLGDSSADTNTINGTTTVNAPMTFGADDTGHDVKFFGATASANMLWDESADDLIFAGAASVVLGASSTLTLTAGAKIISSVSNAITPVMLSAPLQVLAAGGGAVTITEYYTTMATDGGGDAMTLADSTVVGQLKKIQLITDGGGDAVLTPTTLNGGTTITFADAGDFCVLMWDGSGWQVLELNNAADGATAPVLA